MHRSYASLHARRSSSVPSRIQLSDAATPTTVRTGSREAGAAALGRPGAAVAVPVSEAPECKCLRYQSRCDAWGAACSPRRLDALRHELVAVRADAERWRARLHAATTASSHLARELAESRQHLCTLMEEERGFAEVSGEHVEPDPKVAAATSATSGTLHLDGVPGILGLRKETETLAEEVSELAECQLQRCRDVRNLRRLIGVARLRQHRQRANAVQNAALQSALQDLRGLSRRCEAKSTELDEVMENTAALRHRMGFLKEEVASTKAEAAMAASVVGEAPLEILEALQRELGAEEQRTKLQRMLATTQEGAQAALHHQVQDLKAALQESEASSVRAAAEVQDAEGREEAHVSKVERERQRNSVLVQEARQLVAAHKLLEVDRVSDDRRDHVSVLEVKLRTRAVVKFETDLLARQSSSNKCSRGHRSSRRKFYTSQADRCLRRVAARGSAMGLQSLQSMSFPPLTMTYALCALAVDAETALVPKMQQALKAEPGFMAGKLDGRMVEQLSSNLSLHGDLIHRLDSDPDGSCSYQVGGRYKVARPLEVWSNESLDGTRLESLVPKKDTVLVIQLSREGSRALVIPQPAEHHAAGFISLEDAQRGSRVQPALDSFALPGSWDLRARYTVRNPATLREGPEIGSGWVGELKVGAEVLLLDFGVIAGTSGKDKARLRALISADDKIGWMSPETGDGDQLLEPVNLLSRKVVELHRQSLRQSATGLKKSYHQGGNCPWEVGATYRMLEKAVVRLGPELKSQEVFKASSGCLVLVKDINNVEVAGGWCPVAFVNVEEGPERGRTGWVRCTAKDGHDVMDTRDHKEYDKVIRKMRESAGEVPSNATPAMIQAAVIMQLKQAEEAKREEEQAAQRESENTDGLVQQEREEWGQSEEPTWERDGKEVEPAVDPAYISLNASIRELEETVQDERLHMPDKTEIDNNGSWCVCSCGN
ncbi:unnamed protein product [Symbiodinium natans]|uniref:Uncharacterized protein n=1 Tax=Symbiodinium natans TaxID=878477 RepID=A0A812KA66_9DINO|nr:unnamed protein product [Symbiodinium natans]